MPLTIEEIREISARYTINEAKYEKAFNEIPHMVISLGVTGASGESCSNHLDSDFIARLKNGEHLKDSLFVM